jgi:hypothetical protein
VSNNSSTVAWVFVTAVTLLSTRCLVKIGEIFTEQSRCLATKGGYTYRHRLTGVFFNYAAEMGLNAVIYVPRFIKIGPGVQKLMGGDTQTHTHWQQRDLISLIYFFKIRKAG